MNTIVEPAFGIIPVELIRPSATNPRKRFDNASLAELANSIKQSGLGQPILVRPLPDIEDDIPDRVEIIAGERRFRACKLAGIEMIPAIVRDMSDVEVLEFQLVENLQREDVHPIEEAEGYERLMQQHRYSADQLAERVGKSRSYIYGRLKFCALAPAARTAFYEGKLTASTALLVARIPLPALQEQATKEISSWNGSDPMSYRQAVRHVQSRYMLELDEAPFEITDVKLVPAAGSCQDCPKRTGNQPELFSDIQNADVCTDPDCFDGKKKAHYALVFHAAQKKGIPVHERGAKDAPGGYSDPDFVTGDAGLWRFDRITDEARNKDIEAALPADLMPPPASYLKGEDGEMIAVYEKTAIQEALEKAGLRLTLEQHNQAVQDKLNGTGRPEDGDAGPSQKEIERQAKLAEIQRRVDLENSIRLTIYKQVREHADNGLGTGLLRILVKLVLMEHHLPKDVISYGFDASTDEAIAEHIDKPTTRGIELERILMDLLVGEVLTVTSWELEHNDFEDDGVYRALLDLATAAGVDTDGISKELTEKAEAERNAGAAADEARDQDGDEVGADDAPAAVEHESTGDLAIGDRVRIKNGLKGPNGRARKCSGKEGTIEAIVDAYYSVRTGPRKHELVANLVWNEIEKLEDAEAHAAVEGGQEDKKTVPEAAWPFPIGAQP